ERFIGGNLVNIGSWGGRHGADGLEGASWFLANVAQASAETQEESHGIRILRRAYRPDSGGPGRWRGGLGLEYDVQLLGAEGVLVLRTGRRDFVPYGLDGGRPGTTTTLVLNPGTDAERAL